MTNCSGRGIDYDSGPFNLIIPARSISFLFSIEIIDDNILEDFESFSLTISSSVDCNIINILIL